MAWENLNICTSMTQTFGTALTQLSSYVCSEVYFVNLDATNDLIIIDYKVLNPTLSGNNYFRLQKGKEVTIRGITNSNQLSAMSTASTVQVAMRTQYFSYLPLNIY